MTSPDKLPGDVSGRAGRGEETAAASHRLPAVELGDGEGHTGLFAGYRISASPWRAAGSTDR